MNTENNEIIKGNKINIGHGIFVQYGIAPNNNGYVQCYFYLSSMQKNVKSIMIEITINVHELNLKWKTSQLFNKSEVIEGPNALQHKSMNFSCSLKIKEIVINKNKDDEVEKDELIEQI